MSLTRADKHLCQNVEKKILTFIYSGIEHLRAHDCDRIGWDGGEEKDQKIFK